MEHILVAAFDRYSEAEEVKIELLNKGVSNTDIQLSGSNDASLAAPAAGTTTDRAATATREPADASMGEKISAFFGSIFGSDDTSDSRYASAYPEAIRRGSTVVTVTVADDAQVPVVEEILERHGAIDIDERSASWSADTLPGDTRVAGGLAGDTATTARGLDETATDRTAIPVIEENLKVGKRENNLGRVRVVSRMTERPVEETVSLKEEHAVIERHPVDRPASAAELSTFREGSMEIQETTEEAVVEKTARVVEEVMVGKESTHREETVRDTVRRTDVDVETDRTGSATPDMTGKRSGL